MHSRTHMLAAVLCSGLAASLASTPAHAGPLDPPQGPVSSTYRTLSEVEPRIPIGPSTTPGDHMTHFRITEPGSYYLTGNITLSDKYGIVIDTSHVTIDLMGFELVGEGNSVYGGIFVPSAIEDVTVRSGTVRGWAHTGVDLARVTGSRVDGVTVIGCHEGITAGRHALISDCISIGNLGGYGIDCSTASVVTRCTAQGNYDGIYVGTGGVIEQCAASENLRHGFDVGWGATISGCAASGNGDAGIHITADSVASHNVCRLNGRAFHVFGDSNRLENNHASFNDVGYDVDGRWNVITGNTASRNDLNWDVREMNACLVVKAKLAGSIRGDEGGVAPGPDQFANLSVSN